VAEAVGWNAVNGLSAGTLTVTGGNTGGGTGKTLSGDITIMINTERGLVMPPSSGVTAGTVLVASYSGSEEVTYQWYKDGVAVYREINSRYIPTEGGSYTVTASASGYNSKTSNAVRVTLPPYIITGSGYSFTATRGGATVGTANQPIQTIITDIRTHAAGADCTIQFGNGTNILSISRNSNDPLSIINFNNDGGTWGLVTLTGKIASSTYNSGTETSIILIGGAVSVNSSAYIENTGNGSVIIWYGNSDGTLTISGGTVSATSGNAISFESDGTLTISGGTVSATSGNAVRSHWGTGVINISGGTVSVTTGVAVYDDQNGIRVKMINISGGTISATTGIAIRNGKSVTVSGSAMITSANTNTSQGTICILDFRYDKIVIEGGTVENTSTTTGNAIRIFDYNEVSITGGTVLKAGNGNYAVYKKDETGTVTIGAGARILGNIYPPPITIAAIQGVTVPAAGGTPVTSITENAQYSGTVTWNGNPSTFAQSTQYTATITLTAKGDYTLQGVASNFFTVSGATATNSANSGVITAVFPATGAAAVNIAAIQGVTAPVAGGTPVKTITENAQYSGTVAWSPNHSTFAAGTVYTATITLTPKTGYTLQGVAANFFKVAGATSVSNSANSGVITATFPAVISPQMTVTNTAEWINAITAIASNPTGNYTLTIGGSFSVDGRKGDDVYSFGTTPAGSSLTVTLKADSSARTVSLSAVNGYILCVNKNQTLVIDSPNLTLQGNTDNKAYALVALTVNAALELRNGKITGNSGGRGVAVNGGTFTMYGGTISDNTESSTADGGGVSVGGGIFTMYGGTISGNITSSTSFGYGGGVSVDYFGSTGGTFIMYGGTISDNTAQYGGGVYLGANGSTFRISGGTIYGSNEAEGLKNISRNGGPVALSLNIPNANPIAEFGAFSGSTWNKAGDLSTTSDTIKVMNGLLSVNTAAIQGVADPVAGGTPVSAVTETAQYSGTVTWSPNHSVFASGTQYTATITLTPKTGYTTQGVTVNFFTVAGATTASNSANSGVVTAVFPPAITYALGDTGPGGGKVFYYSAEGFTMKDNNQVCHYLEAAPSDSGTRQWASPTYESTSINGTASEMGTGRKNTAIILAVDVYAPAAQACKDYNGGGRADWFLPSFKELEQLYSNKSFVDNMGTGYYWSSWEYLLDSAWRLNFSDGTWNYSTAYKNTRNSVRAVRAF